MQRTRKSCWDMVWTFVTNRTARNPPQSVSGITLLPISRFDVVVPQHQITAVVSPYDEIYGIFSLLEENQKNLNHLIPLFFLEQLTSQKPYLSLGNKFPSKPSWFSEENLHSEMQSTFCWRKISHKNRFQYLVTSVRLAQRRDLPSPSTCTQNTHLVQQQPTRDSVLIFHKRVRYGW